MQSALAFQGSKSQATLDAARLLLDHGAAVNAADSFESTELATAASFAVYDGDTRFISLLLNHGASLETKDAGGKTALIRAALMSSFLGKTQCLEFLLDHGANVDATDKQGQSALIAAIKWNTQGKLDA